MIYDEYVECPICHEHYLTRDMERIFTGRTQLICYKCYQNGARKVDHNLNKKHAAKVKAIQEGRKKR